MAKSTIKQRAKEFGVSLIPYLKEYGKETIRDFYDYWTEHNANGKKMRFEMEKIFSVSRRLATWKKHQDQWNFKKEEVRETNQLTLNHQEVEHIGTSTPGRLHDPLEVFTNLITELPTTRAMNDMKKIRVPDSIRKIVETMALHKEDLVKAIGMIVYRERAVMKLMRIHYDLEKIGAKDIDWSKVKIEFEFDGSKDDQII